MRNSLDCFGTRCKKPGDTFALVKAITRSPSFLYPKGDAGIPADAGRLYSRSAGRWQSKVWARFFTGFGAINATHYTAMLKKKRCREKNLVLPDRSRGPHGHVSGPDSNYKVKIPLHHFLAASVSLPPMGKREVSIVPAEFGATWTLRKSPFEIHLSARKSWPGLVLLWRCHAHGRRRKLRGSAIEVPMSSPAI